VLFLLFSIEIDELRPEELEKALLHLDLPQHEIVGCVAQWLVHLHDILEVLGSIPGGG